MAATTGMRRRDCALLKWKDVNLDSGIVLTRAHKTGKRLGIPILAPLEAALRKAAQNRHSTYCFPVAAEMFESNPDGLNHRLKKLLARAGIPNRRAELEQPERRLRKAPGLGFHNFKGAFVTIALNAGIPVEMIKKITGNIVTSVLENHYYLPDVAEVGSVLRKKMPAALAGITVPSAQMGAGPLNSLKDFVVRIRPLVEAISPTNALTIRTQLLEALEQKST